MNILLLARRTFSFSHVVFILALLTLFAFQFEKFANDPGVGWHLATGEYLLQNETVPVIDPFLASDPSSEQPRAWVSDQWLSDLFLRTLYNAGSWELLYNVFGFIYLLTFFIILFPAVKNYSHTFIGAAVAVFLAFKLAQIHFILRPVLFSFPLFAYCYIKLLKFNRNEKESENELIAQKVPWILVPIFILWANIHPSFVIGLLLLLLLVTGKVLDQFLIRDSDTFTWQHLSRHFKTPIILFVCCALATLINPYGYNLHLSILDLSGSKFFMNLNEEWLSPNFDEVAGKIFLSVLGYILIGIFLGGKVSWKAFEYLTLVFFTIFSLKGIRFFPYFGIVAAPLLADSLRQLGHSKIFHNYRSFRKIKECFTSIESKECYSVKFVSVTLLALLAWGSVNKTVPIFNSLFNSLFDLPIGPSREKFPYAAMEALKSIDSEDPTIVVFSTPDWGGFITFVGNGRIKAVMDDRNTLLGEDIYKEFLDVMKPGGDWLKLANRYGADYLLISAKSPIVCDIERSLLEIIYQDSQAVLVKL